MVWLGLCLAHPNKIWPLQLPQTTLPPHFVVDPSAFQIFKNEWIRISLSCPLRPYCGLFLCILYSVSCFGLTAPILLIDSLPGKGSHLLIFSEDAMNSVHATRGLLIDGLQYKKSAEQKNCLFKMITIGVPCIIVVVIIYFVQDAARR